MSPLGRPKGEYRSAQREGSPTIRKTVTVVICDLVGSTALAEQIDPEALHEVTDRYFDAMAAEIARHGGKIEKYIGDAIMAAFGLPRAHEDDALRAVRAAASMRSALVRVNTGLLARYGVELANEFGGFGLTPRSGDYRPVPLPSVARRHVDVVSEDIACVRDNVTDVDADAKLHAMACMLIGTSFRHAALYLDRAPNRLHDAGELEQYTVTGRLDDSAAGL